MHSFRRTETFKLVLSFKLLADRQPPNALPGRCEDGVDQGWGERRHARLACAAWRRIGIGSDDGHTGHHGCPIPPDPREATVAAPLHLAALLRYLPVFCEAPTH